MSTPAWQPARIYQTGSIVTPRTIPPSGPISVVNGGFSGSSNWDFSGGAVYDASTGFASPGSVRLPGNVADGVALNQSQLVVSPASNITATAMIQQGASVSGATSGWVEVHWFDAADGLVKIDKGNVVRDGSGGAWHQTRVVSQRPAGASYGRAGIHLTSVADHNHAIWGDNLTVSGSSASLQGLMYRAVQPASGLSGSEEPVWPPTLGVQVVDNEVVWEAISISRVVWQASPVMVTGPTEPAWAVDIGGEVADGTVKWKAVNPITQDVNCPHSRVVAIAKFKVFAADKDVVRFTATLAPQDWTSEQDAGYLGVGLNQGSANHVSVLNVYRANLVAMNPVIFQQWQIDPDPSLMDMLDRMDGIGSSWHLAAVPVADDLFYLSSRGVRTVGVSGATNNLLSGDVGLPVDTMIQELTSELVARNLAGGNEQPLGLYWPGMGQYWLSYNRVAIEGDDRIGGAIDLCPTIQVGDRYAEVMVYTITQVGAVGAWSRYVFPFAIDDWAQEGDDLYVRDGDRVFSLSEELGSVDLFEPGTGAPFDAIIQWPWLDMGRPGQDKQMESFDFVGYGSAEIEFGYDQSEPGWFTEPYQVDPDTVPAQAVPMALNAPSYSVRIRYHGWQPGSSETDGQRHWSFNAMAINFS